jgi:hypothetical protein
VTAPVRVADDTESGSRRYRWIVEMTCMRNNDEIVVHMDEPTRWDTFKSTEFCKFLEARRSFSEPHLVICRPVLAEDIVAGLKTDYVGQVDDEHAPEVTRALDALYTLWDETIWRREHFSPKYRTPVDILTDIIAKDYCDCMSSGMPHYKVIACRRLLQRFGYDPETHLYPCLGDSQKEWYTLGDFMRETGDVDVPRDVLPAVERVLGQLAYEGVPSADR